MRGWTFAGWPTLKGSGAFKNIKDYCDEKVLEILVMWLRNTVNVTDATKMYTRNGQNGKSNVTHIVKH